MKTSTANIITAKELRDNLGSVINGVSEGEQIFISYRGAIRAKLEPVFSSPRASKKLSGLDRLITYQKNNPKKFAEPDNRTIKEIYHEMLDKKYAR